MKSGMLKFGFCGSGRFAAQSLSLISEKVRPEWVITSTPRPSGRGLRLQNTPVFNKAEELGLEIRTTERLSADPGTLEWIRTALPDLILVIDFGHMIKEPLLSMTKLGCINIHPSMLPSYRGSAPVQRALMDGLRETGVTIFRLDEGMDSGPVLHRVPVAITDDDDTASIIDKTCRAGCEKLLEYLTEIPPEDWRFLPQGTEGVSMAPKIEKSEGKIDWSASSENISNRVRALALSPGTYCECGGKRLRIHKVLPADGSGKPGELLGLENGFPLIACGSGSIILKQVQLEGKKIQNADEWIRGSRIRAGDIIC